MARNARVRDRRSIEIDPVQVEVVRKDIENLHLRVYPPDGSVSMPLRMSDEVVRTFVASQMDWIRRPREL